MAFECSSFGSSGASVRPAATSECSESGSNATRQESQFWERVDRSGGAGSCWLWTGAVNNCGYGVFRERGGGRWWTSHRYALTLKLGRELADGEVTRHSCDNPPCCNLDHLDAGTVRDNVADMMARGRHAWRKPPPADARGQFALPLALGAQS